MWHAKASERNCWDWPQTFTSKSLTETSWSGKPPGTLWYINTRSACLFVNVCNAKLTSQIAHLLIKYSLTWMSSLFWSSPLECWERNFASPSSGKPTQVISPPASVSIEASSKDCMEMAFQGPLILKWYWRNMTSLYFGGGVKSLHLCVQGEAIVLVCVQVEVTMPVYVNGEVTAPVCLQGEVTTLKCAWSDISINQSALCTADRQKRCAHKQQLLTNPQGFKSLPNKPQFVKNTPEMMFKEVKAGTEGWSNISPSAWDTNNASTLQMSNWLCDRSIKILPQSDKDDLSGMPRSVLLGTNFNFCTEELPSGSVTDDLECRWAGLN